MAKRNRPMGQPETAEYIQKMIPRNLDSAISYAGSVEFSFRLHTNEKGYQFPVPGIKTAQIISYKIESNSDLPFKPGDILRFDRDDRRRYTIDSIGESASQDKNYRRAYLYPNDEEEVKFKVISLK